MRIKTCAVLFSALMAAGCVSQQKYDAEVSQVGSLTAQNQTYLQLNQQLSTEVKANQVEIQQLQNQLKVRMVNEILFREGGWTLNAMGEATLAKIVPTLSSLQGHQIVVEGFTDNVPIGPELRKHFPTNWELSSARADDVLRFLVAKGVPQNLVSAQGFGDSRPVASNNTPEGRAKNRRVEIVIMSANRP
jgi:chemotaxis protein MotB